MSEYKYEENPFERKSKSAYATPSETPRGSIAYRRKRSDAERSNPYFDFVPPKYTKDNRTTSMLFFQ
jgi:hypothetical protein